LFGIVWGLAIFGIALEAFSREGKRVIPVVIYLIMGWLIVIAVNPLLQTLTLMGFILLLSGGLFYTFGVIFFALSDRVRHSHGIWHLFVLAGSVTHYFAVFYYVA